MPFLSSFSGKYHLPHSVHFPEYHSGIWIIWFPYHFPKTWSAACVANRELIKEAQRQAHALEHDYSYAAMEWHIRFLRHYFRVFKGGADPEPGMKHYSRFYQYTFVAIYRELKAAQQPAEPRPTPGMEAEPQPTAADDVTFNPIGHLRARRTYPLQHVIAHRRATEEFSPPEPLWRDFCKIVT